MRADVLARSLLLALLSLSVLSLPGLGQSSAFQEVSGVEVSASCPWPDQLRKGYVPLRIDLVNTRGEGRSVSITANRGWGDESIRVEASVSLGPGEHASVELAAPAWRAPGPYWSWFQANYSVVIDSAGRGATLSNLGAQENLLEGVRAGIVVSRESVESNVVERFESELATGEVEGEANWVNGRQVTEMRADLDLASVSFGNLPRRIEAYTSLDVVIVDVRRGLPDPARLEPILAWVRAGGDAVFAGAGDARQLLGELPTAARWLEDRFVLEDFGDAVVWRCGLGRLAAQVSDSGSAEAEFPGSGCRLAVEWLFANRADTVPGPETRPSEVPSIPGLGELPYRVFALLLVLFALAIGPLNFFFVQRAGRPALLLVTIPVTAILAATFFLVYGLLHQGIDVKSATRSVVLLDQRAHRAASAEAREVFVGLTPGGGLRPGAGTVVLPVEEPHASRSVNARYRIDERGATRLSGRYLPARLPVDQVVLTERAARVRLDVARDGDSLRATNGLDATVRVLRLVDADGEVWGLAGELAPGASAALVPYSPSVSREGGQALVTAHRAHLSEAPATYAALLDANPVSDDCGVETTETRGDHLLLGVLDNSPERWR